MAVVGNPHGNLRQLTVEQARRISEIRVARAKAERTRKESPTRHKLELRHGEEIKRLREQEKFSWREVARFLEKNYRLRVSHTYLRKVYDQKAGSEDTPTS